MTAQASCAREVPRYSTCNFPCRTHSRMVCSEVPKHEVRSLSVYPSWCRVRKCNAWHFLAMDAQERFKRLASNGRRRVPLWCSRKRSSSGVQCRVVRGVDSPRREARCFIAFRLRPSVAASVVSDAPWGAA